MRAVQSQFDGHRRDVAAAILGEVRVGVWGGRVMVSLGEVRRCGGGGSRVMASLGKVRMRVWGVGLWLGEVALCGGDALGKAGKAHTWCGMRHRCPEFTVAPHAARGIPRHVPPVLRYPVVLDCL